MQTDKLLNRSIGSKCRGELVQNFSAVASAAGSGILRLRFSPTTSIFSAASHFQILFLFLLLLRINKIKFNKKSPNKICYHLLQCPLALLGLVLRLSVATEIGKALIKVVAGFGHDPSSTLGLRTSLQGCLAKYSMHRLFELLLI
jgi:hypothetical protein